MAKKRLSLEERLTKYRAWEMARRAESVALTHTTSHEQTASGALTGDATRTLATMDSGSPQTTLGVGRIPDGRGAVSALMAWAKAVPNVEGSARNFLRKAFLPPTRKKPGSATLRMATLTDGSLGFWECDTIARQWDSMGPSTPIEFVDGLSCEVGGHIRGDSVSAVLRDTTWESVRISAMEEDKPDEYGKWRYGDSE